MGEKVDFVYLIAHVPGRHSGDQVHKVKKAAAPSFYILLLQARPMATLADNEMYSRTFDEASVTSLHPLPPYNRRQKLWRKFIFTCSPGTGPSNT